jgi:hypothetical protein
MNRHIRDCRAGIRGRHPTPQKSKQSSPAVATNSAAQPSVMRSWGREACAPRCQFAYTIALASRDLALRFRPMLAATLVPGFAPGGWMR